MNGYELSRKWFDWSFENPEQINPNHTALYFFIIEHCNRLGWKEKFGLPTTMAKEAIGIRSYNTYINTLNDLVEFGFINLIEKSKNQYSSNIIALSNFDKAHDKALDKALIKHTTKQGESIVSIDKQETKNNKFIIPTFNDVLEYCMQNNLDVDGVKFINFYESKGWMVGKNKMKDWKAAIRTWVKPKPQVEISPEELKAIKLGFLKPKQ
jgi:hypothetical protein